MRILTIVLLSAIGHLVLAQGNGLTVTYTAGDIPTNYPSWSANCNGSSTTISVLIPSSLDSMEVSSIDISYNMTAANNGWISDQESQVHCQNTNLTEASFFAFGNNEGTQTYTRTGVTIANGTYAGGTTLVFEMRAWRTFAGTGCNTTYNKVDDGTWTIAVYGCPVEDVRLSSQADVDLFGSAFDCNVINGDLHLGPLVGASDISTLGVLSSIEIITGNLEIRSLLSPDLLGLQNLVEVGGGVLLFDCNEIRDLDDLSSLQSCGLFLDIASNDLLEDMTGLSQLEASPDRLALIDNGSLLSLTGLEGVDSIAFECIIESNSQLGNLDGLDSVSYIGDYLTIASCHALADLEGFQNLQPFTGALLILNNDDLTSLDGLPIGQSLLALGISNNLSLSDVDHLESVENIEQDLSIRNNTSLVNLDGLHNIDTIRRDIILDFNLGLESLDTLDITYIGGQLRIVDNPALTDISALQSVKTLLGGVECTGNGILRDCCILNYIYPTATAVPLSVDRNGNGCRSQGEIAISCSVSDPDNDGISLPNDNCPDTYNPLQQDADSDDVGNACDNCPMIANADQLDADDNYIGDACQVVEPGQVGINTTQPQSGLEIMASDLYLNDPQRGLILTNAAGGCFRVVVDLDGGLRSIPITCP